MTVSWIKNIDLSEIAAETRQFYNSEILKRRFSDLSLQKTNCSQQQVFQTGNLKESIHIYCVYERGSVYLDQKNFLRSGVSDLFATL